MIDWMPIIIAEALCATKTQVDSVNGEENLNQLYTKALHDLGKEIM